TRFQFRLPERFCTFLRIGYLNKLSCDNLFRDCFAFARNDDIGFRQPEMPYKIYYSLFSDCLKNELNRLIRE
ncbi:MAG: hypothetical protein IJM09_01100, partial [Neisseriaceae bacterium]|nr:hypothetical protein [Neisseriaceae bacterium]